MKEERLLRAFSEVDDKFVEGSAPINLNENEDTFFEQSAPQIITVKKHSPIMKIAGIGAACAAAVGIGFALKFLASQGNTGLLTNPAANPGDNVSLTERGQYINDCLAVVKRWDELAINEQYNLFTFYGSNFNSGGNTVSNTVSEDMLYGFLGNVTAQGYDIYEDKTYEKEASVYSIKNLSEKGVLAVKFAEDENYYIYFTYDYKPYTLGEFIEELNLRENIVFGSTASCRTVENGYLTYMIDETYSGIDSEKIWELLSDADIRTESIFDYKDFDERLETELEFSVDIPIFGIKNHSMQVTKGGYVHTNMFFGQSMLFNVGKDKTDAFVKYVKENCKGEIVRKSEQKTDEDSLAYIEEQFSNRKHQTDGETSPSYDPTKSNSADTAPEYPELPQ